MTRPHLRLHYRWSLGLKRFVWFVSFIFTEEGKRYLFSTSYSNSSAEALKKVGEYWSIN